MCSKGRRTIGQTLKGSGCRRLVLYELRKGEKVRPRKREGERKVRDGLRSRSPTGRPTSFETKFSETNKGKPPEANKGIVVHSILPIPRHLRPTLRVRDLTPSHKCESSHPLVVGTISPGIFGTRPDTLRTTRVSVGVSPLSTKT